MGSAYLARSVVAVVWMCLLVDVRAVTATMVEESSNPATQNEVLHTKGDGAGAVKLNGEAIKLALNKGESAKALIERADYCLYSLNQPEKALADYKKAALLSPKNPLAWAGMSDAYRGLKRKDDAYKVLNQAIDAIPDSAVLFKKRADMRSNFLMDKEALADINEAIKLAPTAEYYQARADILIGLGDFDRALEDCETIIAKEPENVRGYAMRGNLYLNLDKYQQAIHSFTKALSIRPVDKFARQNRAYCYDKLGRSREALADYRKLVEVEPTNTKWRLQKANLESLVGDKRLAIEDYTAAINQSQQPILARIYQERARLYDKLGNRAKAAADRKKAQSMSKSFYADILERKK